jgi:hypothetical protein
MLSKTFQPCAHLLLLSSFFSNSATPASAAELFNGKDLSAWKPPLGNWTVAKAVTIAPGAPDKLVLSHGQGIFVNGPEGKTVDLVSKEEFGDLQLHVEFCLPKHSNSGIYLMGRYEVQIYDSFGVEKDQYPGIECGGIYPRWVNEKNVDGRSPIVNASKPPGEWQSFDITFLAPRFDATGKKIANAKLVKVIHNGKVIHDDAELKGPTRGPIAEDEKPTGPLRLQGDHGAIAFRNLKVQKLN